MKHILWIGLLFLHLVSHADNYLLFEKANDAYSQQNYVESLNSYHAIADEGWQSSELFYNMGNAYFRIGKLGMSILYYEKALAIDPKNPDVLHNLQMAERRKIDVFEIVPEPIVSRIWKGLLGITASSTWAIIGLLSIFISAGLLVLFLIQKKRSTLSFSMYMIFGISGLLFLFLGYEKNQLDQNQKFGILISDNTYVKSEPDTGEDLFIIHEGSKAKIEESFNGWLKIRTPDGKSGWVETESFQKI